MKRTSIQIYEVQKPAEARALAAMGVDQIGSVLVSEDRWKQPAIRRTVQAVQDAGSKSGIIPISKDPVKIFLALDYYRPDFVHLCDTLSPFPKERQTLLSDFDALLSLQIDIKDRFPQIDIMRSLSIPRPDLPEAADIEKNVLDFACRFAPFSDYFLIDTLLAGISQPVDGFVGITGETCDWNIAAAVIAASPIPVILAGGISDQNAYDAIVRLRPAGVDSCTKTNAKDRQGRAIRFKKDMKKVRKLVDEVRRADAFLSGDDASEKPHAKRI
jgi:phosphoribosylanthranilate isomerase